MANRRAGEGRSLRDGYTTGSCAALAAQAATRMLLTGTVVTEASLTTPKGVCLTVPVCDASVGSAQVCCAVVKDAGDDPDVTNGMSVYATVRRTDGCGVEIDGGEGVGRVTKPGLDQPVGAAAINSVPRKMIEREVRAVCGECGYDGGIRVIVSIPGGERAAAKTFNANLGIVGGLSVLGTSGIVEPMSVRAVVETIRVGMNVVRAQGEAGVIVTPGNYGESFLRAMPDISRKPHVVCSNYIGEALEIAAESGFREVVVVGHAGKLVKLSGGVMDTHSRTADCRLELLALHAALAGVGVPALHRVLDAVTVDDGFAVLEEFGVRREAVVDGLLARAESYCRRRAGAGVEVVGVVVFSNRLGLLGMSVGAREALARWEKSGG